MIQKPEPPSLFGAMEIVASRRFVGRCYRCRCGWTAWGRARKHAEKCPEVRRMGG